MMMRQSVGRASGRLSSFQPIHDGSNPSEKFPTDERRYQVTLTTTAAHRHFLITF